MTTPQPQDATNSPPPVSQDAPNGSGATETDFLAATDWTQYACQCPIHACAQPAVFAVRIHALDACNEPGLTFGNRVELRCRACTARLRAEVWFRLGRPKPCGPLECRGCGAPIAEVGDVVREVVAL